MTTAYTTEEVRDHFISQVCAMVRYWEGQNTGERDKIIGAVFSVLVILDGESGALPGFQVIPDPHPDDRDYLISQGERYYPPSEPNGNDITGALHDLFLRAMRA